MLVNVWGPVNTWDTGAAPGTQFTVDYPQLSINSPFAGDPRYSAIVIGNSCIHDALTSPDNHPISMSGDGEFTIFPGSLPVTQTQTINFSIWDGVEGAGAIMTILPNLGAIASINGVPLVNIASINGIPIANIDTLNGVKV